MYSALIATISVVRKHSQYERLQCAEVCGHRVIVDETIRDGQRVVFFPDGGRLDEDFARENNVPARIKTIRIRGEISEGLALPVEALSPYTDTAQLKDGDRISVLNGTRICWMYFSPHDMEIDVGTSTLVKYHGQRGTAGIVRIPWGVEKIERFAFFRTRRVREAIIPYSVSEMGEGAFCSAVSLEKVSIPGSIARIATRAFELCGNLTDVTLQEGVKIIEYGAFGQCTGLKSIDLPDSVVRIERGAFYKCTGLKTIRIPKNAEEIGNLLDIPNLESASIDPGNRAYALADGVLFTRDMKTLLRYPPWKRDAEYTVPDGVETIAEMAFEENRFLEEVTVSGSVKRIQHRAFQNCRGLYSITIPPNVTDMGNFVFIGINNVPNRRRKSIHGSLAKASVGSIMSALNSIGTEEGVLIRGEKGSMAWRYAELFGCAFEKME